jgi:hypothetical protein
MAIASINENVEMKIIENIEIMKAKISNQYGHQWRNVKEKRIRKAKRIKAWHQ